MTSITVGATLIRALEGDLTAQAVDAVVNAANEHLAHGGGVAAAIVRAGGQVIQDESLAWVRHHGPLAPGTAAITGAGALPARFVVHVVGPRHTGSPSDPRDLTAAVDAALDAAAGTGSRTVAMPAISAGIFGYPVAEATGVIARAAAGWSSRHHAALDEILLVGYDAATTAGFAEALDHLR